MDKLNLPLCSTSFIFTLLDSGYCFDEQGSGKSYRLVSAKENK